MSENYTPTKRRPMKGVEVWTNPKNKFTVFQLHFTADPSKRSKEFVDAVKSGMPIRQFLQEYDLKWLSFMGLPVYGDWDKDLHAAEGLKPQVGLPLLRGWDFGLTPACIICQVQGEKLVVLREITEFNMGAKRFVPKVIGECQQVFPNWPDQRKHFIDFIDPSGEFRNDTDEGTCARVMDDNGLNPVPGVISWEERKGSVDHWLSKFDKNGACLQVNIEHCPLLYRGFEGGYRFTEKVVEVEPSKLRPIKDEHSHIHDALQMVTTKINDIMRRKKVSMRSPNYLFGSG